MPTLLTHLAVPLAFGLGLGARAVSPRLLAAGALASIAPDLDVIGFHFGVAYASIEGHRGLFHSLAFALLLALLAATAARSLRATRRAAFAFVLASAASHGLLDMLTTGGLGVAWFWPISDERCFLPWHVIRVSPLTLHRLLGPTGRVVLESEWRVVWLPAIALAATLWCWRRLRPRAEKNAPVA